MCGRCGYSRVMYFGFQSSSATLYDSVCDDHVSINVDTTTLRRLAFFGTARRVRSPCVRLFTI